MQPPSAPALTRGGVVALTRLGSVLTINLGIDPAVHGLGDDRRLQAHVALGDRVSGKVFETQEPVLISGDLDQDPRFRDVPKVRTARSAFVYPLIVDGIPLGVMNANRTSLKELYGPADLAAAQVVCAQIGRAIQNARLFSAVVDDQMTLSMVLNQIFDPIFLVDASGAILLCNDISCTIPSRE